MESRYTELSRFELEKKAKGGFLSKPDPAAIEEINRRDKHSAEITKKHEAESFNREAVALVNCSDNFEGALLSIEKAIELMPNNKSFCANKGFILLAMTRPEDALRVFQSIIKEGASKGSTPKKYIEQCFHGRNFDVYFGIFNAIGMLNNTSAATTFFESIGLSPLDAAEHIAFSAIYYGASKFHLLNKNASNNSLDSFFKLWQKEIDGYREEKSSGKEKIHNNVSPLNQNASNNSLGPFFKLGQKGIDGHVEEKGSGNEKIHNIVSPFINIVAADLRLDECSTSPNRMSEDLYSKAIKQLYAMVNLINAVCRNKYCEFQVDSDNIFPSLYLNTTERLCFQRNKSNRTPGNILYNTGVTTRENTSYFIIRQMLVTAYMGLAAAIIGKDTFKNMDKIRLGQVPINDISTAYSKLCLVNELDPSVPQLEALLKLFKEIIDDKEKQCEIKRKMELEQKKKIQEEKIKAGEEIRQQEANRCKQAEEKEKAERPKAQSEHKQLSIIAYKDIFFSDKDKLLGEGGFGTVRKAKWQNIDVAAKQIRAGKLNQASLDEFKAEAERHATFQHLNIVTLYGVCLEPGKYTMVLELMVYGSLYNILHNNSDLPWKLRLQIAKDIVFGLSYLHSKDIIHRDLKSLNVLLNDRMQAKLSDFGLSKVKTECSTITSMDNGTLLWMAPELFERGNKCTTKSDIYSLAVLLWELASRKIPYEDAPSQKMAAHWIQLGKKEVIPIDNNMPIKYGVLISKCWAQRSEHRPDVQAIVGEISGIVDDYSKKGNML